MTTKEKIDVSAEDTNIEAEAKKQMDLEKTDVANMSDDDIKGLFELDDESLTISRAQERIELEASYRRMQTQLKTAELSQQANEHFDNQQAAASFKQRVSAVKADMQHCLRGIKYLDEKYPDVRDYIRKRKAKGLKL